MSIIVILICLALQKYLQFYSAPFRVPWVATYHRLLTTRRAQFFQSSPMVSLLLLIVPPFVVVTIVFTLVYHWFDSIGYWILSLVWLWYWLDFKNHIALPGPDTSLEDSILPFFHGVFAVIFWFSIGPLWLALYVIVTDIDKHAASVQESSRHFELNKQLLALMDWIPARLLGLSLALTSHFSHIFPQWLLSLKAGIKETSSCVVAWFELALSATGDDVVSESRLNDLMRYSLVLWLVVLVLLAIALLF